MKKTVKAADKYFPHIFLPPDRCMDWADKNMINAAPVWCSVDLRDGNQALVTPMSIEEKVEFFAYLVKLGFKEIEIGFPAASESEYAFTRRLIDENLIPDDVTIQVLTQSREHIIRRTLESLDGAKNVIVHLYNSTSKAQREQVFKKNTAQIKAIAIEGAQQIMQAVKGKTGYRVEYSPESFTGTEPEFALEVCNSVLDIIKPTASAKAIINLPVTVELAMPHVYAQQVEYIHKNLKYRDCVVLSTHPHNDRGTGVADAEMALLAGCDRVEGTLFGNGERTGNVDIVTLAMNMYSQGVDPMLDFSNIDSVTKEYERLTTMKVAPRAPYAGTFVFTAFSGSHQDAIAKGMKCREADPSAKWDVPYLPIDPLDVGRDYEADVIRINSQSGKGGIAYVLEQRFGFNLPLPMREDLSYKIKHVSDAEHRELKSDEVCELFTNEYINLDKPLELVDFNFERNGDSVLTTLTLNEFGKQKIIAGSGNGQFNAAASALKSAYNLAFKTVVYSEHALSEGSQSRAAAYVGLESNSVTVYAAGVDTDIMTASVKALIGSVNKLLRLDNKGAKKLNVRNQYK